MKPPPAEALFRAMAATWPPEELSRLGPWTIRRAPGGGGRATAATADGPVAASDIRAAERTMLEMGQQALFMVRDSQPDLATALEAQGHPPIEQVHLMAGPLAPVAAQDLPRISAFPHWPPLAITDEIWAASGMTPPRRAILDRPPQPKAAVLGRCEDRPAGALFVAMHGTIAVVHSVETVPALRRRGCARNMMVAAARWAAERGAGTLALAVTAANAPAIALYRGLGLASAATYHYRSKEPKR